MLDQLQSSAVLRHNNQHIDYVYNTCAMRR
jgi:hypothetical protein